MPVRVSIVVTIFFAIDAVGSNFGNGRFPKWDELPGLGRWLRLKSMGLDCLGATMPRLHDHRKARGTDQSRAVPQLRRLDLS